MGDDWARLASYVLARRGELGWNAETLAEHAKVNPATISNVETGKGVGRSTLAKVDTALRWKPGSAKRVLEGGEPELAEREPDPDTDPDDEAREIMRRIAALSAARDAIDAEIAELDGELGERNARRVG